MFKGLLSALLLAYCIFISAQKIENLRFEQDGKMINVYYDLKGDNKGGKYTIEIFCSTDGGTNWGYPLNKVIGEVGAAQTPGNNKRIIWDVLAEREKLEGNIIFEIRVIKDGLQTGTFTDERDGHVYKWIRIGEHLWMAENLRYRSNEGSFCYKNEPTFCALYGRLYNWSAANSSCPIGWHLPSEDDWKELIDFLGGEVVAGGKLKEIGTEHWAYPNTDAANESDFNAMPGGYMNGDRNFEFISQIGYWWSSKEYSLNRSNSAWSYSIRYNKKGIFKQLDFKRSGLSVRCIKN